MASHSRSGILTGTLPSDIMEKPLDSSGLMDNPYFGGGVHFCFLNRPASYASWEMTPFGPASFQASGLRRGNGFRLSRRAGIHGPFHPVQFFPQGIPFPRQLLHPTQQPLIPPWSPPETHPAEDEVFQAPSLELQGIQEARPLGFIHHDDTGEV